MELAKLQDLFQRGILDRDESVLTEILDSPKQSRRVLFDVYRDGYPLRLIEALQNDNEALHAYFGGEAFEAMARAYIRAYPSYNPSLRWFSEMLPIFLTTMEPYRGHPEIGELSAIEKALSDAFDAPDAPVITVADLATIPIDTWPTISFVAHPSVSHLELATNAAAIWIALNAKEVPPRAVMLDRPASLFVWRDDAVARFREVAEPELMMWTQAEAGVSFGALCELLATDDENADPAALAAGYLQGWIASGMLTAVRLAGK
jgi:hypothetical protein